MIPLALPLLPLSHTRTKTHSILPACLLFMCSPCRLGSLTAPAAEVIPDIEAAAAVEVPATAEAMADEQAALVTGDPAPEDVVASPAGEEAEVQVPTEEAQVKVEAGALEDGLEAVQVELEEVVAPEPAAELEEAPLAAALMEPEPLVDIAAAACQLLKLLSSPGAASKADFLAVVSKLEAASGVRAVAAAELAAKDAASLASEQEEQEAQPAQEAVEEVEQPASEPEQLGGTDGECRMGRWGTMILMPAALSCLRPSLHLWNPLLHSCSR
jgi:hypothetical protein